MANYYGPLSYRQGSSSSTVVDPRFGTAATPVQPAGWGGTSGGGGATYDGGVRGAGFHVPPGSLNNLTAALVNGATDRRVELAYFGDSTGDGSGSDYGQGGPPRKLRDLMHAVLPNGGRGHLRASTESYDPDHAIVEQNLFGGTPRPDDWPPMGGTFTDKDGATITVQGRGTAVRIFYGNSDGLMTYSVDGGAPQPLPTGTGALYVGGLAEGLHQVSMAKTGTVRTFVAFEFIRDAGVIVHQDAVTGRTSEHYSNFKKTKETATAGSNAVTQQFGLGMTPTGNGPSDYASTPSAQRPNEARNVFAAIFALGINDMSLVTTTDPIAEGVVAASRLSENVAHFITMCRSGNIDPIIVVPHLHWDPRAYRVAGRFKQALVSVAEANSAAWCDYEFALRGAGYGIDENPHRPQVEYDVEAQFLFDNVISRALPEA